MTKSYFLLMIFSMKWDLVKSDFKIDGSLRDIYVMGATIESWQTFLDFIVARKYKTKFTADGNDLSLPQRIEDILKLRDNHALTLSFWLSDAIQINCHFFIELTSSDPIELDIDPKEIQSEKAFALLSDFLVELQKVLSKPVSLTHENSPDSVIVAYN